MGTSKGYDAPKTPQWRSLKTTISRNISSGRATGDVAGKILNKYVNATSDGGGRSNDYYSPAINVAGGFAPFFHAISKVGFTEALRETGIGDISGKTVNEIRLLLLEYFGKNASTVHEVDARNALSMLYDELLQDAKDYNDVEKIFDEKLHGEGFIDYIIKFFGYYVYETFCRSFYEKLTSKIGDEKAEKYLKDIKDYIFSSIEGINIDRDISKINWYGEEGQAEIDNICKDVLDVFGGASI